MQLDRRNLKVTRWLQEELLGCESVLDLGCGQSSLLQYVDGIPIRVGVEYWKPYIDEARKNRIHSDYINSDILDVKFHKDGVDAVMLIDVLEHIEKANAYALLLNMRNWARKKVIISVPNGDIPQDDTYHDGNEKQRHVSQWTPAELENLGYFVKGFGGWKPLRGEGANIIPTKTKTGHYLLSGISAVSEPFVQVAPDYAFHLFAVLDKT
jgi:hypothetical protein